MSNMNEYNNTFKTTGGPSFDERMHDSEIQRNANPYGELGKTTGSPNFDERMHDSEKQRNANPYGELGKTTGGPSFDERMHDSEIQRNANPYGELGKTTGSPSFDERMHDSEIQRNANPYGELGKTTGGPNFDERMHDSEIQRNANPYGELGKTTGGPNYDERLANDEARVQMIRNENKPKEEIIANLIDSFPSNKEELVDALKSVDYRLDLMKKLVSEYRDQFLDIAKSLKKDYSPEANAIVNKKVTEYLCLIETLKSAGYNFGSEIDSYNKNYGYNDPNKPQVMLPEIMDMMHIRRKNGADINIIFPINYNLDNKDNQPKADAVTIIYAIDNHLKNNPYMAAIWKKAGYIPPTNTDSDEISSGIKR